MAGSSETDFREAVVSFRAGRLADAERLFRKVLRHHPRHPATLNLLGALLTHLERFVEAERHLKAALEVDASSDATFYNYGIALKALKRPAEALKHFDRALALNPAVAETWNNSGTVLNDLGQYDEALARFDRAAALKPGYTDAFYNKGKSLLILGRHDEAAAVLDQVLKLKPAMAEAWLARGIALSNLARDEEALIAFWHAHRLKPDLFDIEAKQSVGLYLCSPHLHLGLGDLRNLLTEALLESWAQPAQLAPACTLFLGLNPSLRDSILRATTAWPALLTADALAGPSGVAAFAEDPLLRAVLESVPVFGRDLERFATELRFCLLTIAMSDAGNTPATPVLNLYCSLARQCFINNYVFAQSDQEIELVKGLHDAVVAALASGAAISTVTLVALAAYLPLHSLPGAPTLLDQPWPPAIEAVLAQQVSAPIEEQRLRAAMPVLTPVDDAVTTLVRGQYEESPYPQWAKADPAGTPKTIHALMREKFPASSFVELHADGELAVLVAGCGTGRHAIGAARRFSAAQVLAIDISLASLGYAQRKARSLGLTNIQYAQADIMKLASIGRTFDVIECCGVLHHLADPFAGWRVLLSLLRPGGIMLLGFYSEVARRDIVAARNFIAAGGYPSTPAGIRRCRQDLFETADDVPLKKVTLMADFFSLSGCRDLLFHVQEHRLTPGQIETFLAEHGLQLLGFEIDPQTRQAYATQFPDDPAMTDLARWHRYELDNPYTFLGMYNFWVQKRIHPPGQ